jgi:tol-pal system protein YbgF
MLIPDSKRKTGRTRLLTAAILGLALAGPTFAFELPPALIGAPAQPERMHVAQTTQEAAQLAVRIQRLEEQIRVLTGQVEGLTFQLTQMQTLIARMQEDNEFRFQQFEGGAAPANPNGAATQSGGETPAGASPQDESDVAPTVIPDQPVRPLPGEQEFDPTFTDGSVAPPPSGAAAPATPAPNAVGESADPLLGTGAGEEGAVLGELPVAPPADGQPLNLTFTPGVDTGNPDADAQFTAAYEAVQRGDIEFAEQQFRQFIELYPDNPQTPDAANWLGETLLQRGENEEAAEVLLGAFQAAPESPRAPDLLLRLGIALARAEERETACRTFAEITSRFPNLTDAFRARLTSEMATAECPPA